MQHISSRQNPLYKQIRRLAQGMPVPAGDDQAGSRTASRKIQILLEGIHLCQDWLRHRGQPRRAVFDAERLQGDPELQEIASRVNPRQAVSMRSEEHTSELQSRGHLVCRLMLEKKKQQI